MAKDLVWFKKNVSYNLGVRRFKGDKDGVLLNGDSPFIRFLPFLSRAHFNVCLFLVRNYNILKYISFFTKADIILLARGFLRDPYWALHAAHTLNVATPLPVQYERAFPRPKAHI